MSDTEGKFPDEYLVFEAYLPQDAAMPVKPTRDFNAVTAKRRVRIWLDALLDPGDTERVMLLGDETFEVVLRRKHKAPGSTLDDETPEVLRQAADPPGIEAAG